MGQRTSEDERRGTIPFALVSLFTHRGRGGEAGQGAAIGRQNLPGHHQLRALEVLVEAVLGDVGHSVLWEQDGDPPQQRGGDLAVEGLQSEEEEEAIRELDPDLLLVTIKKTAQGMKMKR